MNLEKFWLAAGAVEAKNEDDGYTVMVLPDGTEVAVENFADPEADVERWLWYEPEEMGIGCLSTLMERWSGDDGFDIDYFSGTWSEEQKQEVGQFYRVDLIACDIFADAYPLKKAIILALCQRFGVEA